MIDDSLRSTGSTSFVAIRCSIASVKARSVANNQSCKVMVRTRSSLAPTGLGLLEKGWACISRFGFNKHRALLVVDSLSRNQHVESDASRMGVWRIAHLVVKQHVDRHDGTETF